MTDLKLNTEEVKKLLNYMIDSNAFLETKGKVPTAIEIVGVPGIGKTSIVKQVAAERGYQYSKLVLSQCEELGDLIGVPNKEYKICREEEDCIWISEKLLDDYRAKGYTILNESRMTYSIPEWVPTTDEGCILCIDDSDRAAPRFTTALMELIDQGEYMSWKLPKNCTIVITNNPDNGEYNLASIKDSAQKSRYISIEMEFSVDAWAKWAEFNSIDERCINFTLMHPEILSTSDVINPRLITKFFNSISFLDKFESNIDLIMMLGTASIGTTNTKLFQTFIHNNLDKIITPKQMLTKELSLVQSELNAFVGNGSKYKAINAAVISQRFSNYCIYLSTQKEVNKASIERIKQILLMECFTEELKFHMVKTIRSFDRVKFRDLLASRELLKYLRG